MPRSDEAADLLVAARLGAGPVPWRDVCPADVAGAYAIQDATLVRLGASHCWKVGAKDLVDQPICAPLPRAAIFESGSQLDGPGFGLRGLEVELAVRLGSGLERQDGPLRPAQIVAAIDAVLPAIEVVETRLADWQAATPLAKLADLQSHGALVLGTPGLFRPDELNLGTTQAVLTIDGACVAATTGGNPAGDVLRLLCWLASHCADRNMPLRAGDIITTGSCTGMIFTKAGAQVRGEVSGIGHVALSF